jgi:hypothetical protein
VTSCEERKRLLAEYSQAVRFYAAAVQKLADLSDAEASTALAVVDRICLTAWHGAERARVALAAHVGKHFCNWLASDEAWRSRIEARPSPNPETPN